MGARPLIFLFMMMSGFLGRACSFQLKYTTRLGPRRGPTAFARFASQMSDKAYTAFLTKTLIAKFVARGPPVRAEEVMLLLDASIRQHTPLPNVLRLKVPIQHDSNVASSSTKRGRFFFKNQAGCNFRSGRRCKPLRHFFGLW